MTQSLARTGRFALIVGAGFVLSIASLELAGVHTASTLWHSFGISKASASQGGLAVNSCDVPKDASSDIYFVSCGGFF